MVCISGACQATTWMEYKASFTDGYERVENLSCYFKGTKGISGKIRRVYKRYRNPSPIYFQCLYDIMRLDQVLLCLNVLLFKAL